MMKIITANTKISAIINANPGAIDAIACINPHFNKLKNPVLRKILAARVTIADAAKIGKCAVEDIFNKLRPLGFIIEYEHTKPENVSPEQEKTTRPFSAQLDVRADINNGQDPFKKIWAQLSGMDEGQVLLLVNSFEPVPLIRILEDKNYKTEVVYVADSEVHTYISKGASIKIDPLPEVDNAAFEAISGKYENKMKTIDVRHLPMPQPMLTILGELEILPIEMALFVHHKKLPMFLLPELKEKKFEITFKTTDDGVKLIIYKQAQA